MAAILHRAMTETASRGCTLWNWGGAWASQTGVYRIERRWGACERVQRRATPPKNRSLLARDAETLRGECPWFFVAPFQFLVER